jgi:hypothetical protein
MGASAGSCFIPADNPDSYETVGLKNFIMAAVPTFDLYNPDEPVQGDYELIRACLGFAPVSSHSFRKSRGRGQPNFKWIMAFFDKFCLVLSAANAESPVLSLALKKRMRLVVALVAVVSETSTFLTKSKRIAQICVEEGIDPAEWGCVGNVMLGICLQHADAQDSYDSKKTQDTQVLPYPYERQDSNDKQCEVTASWSRLFSRFLRYLVPTVVTFNPQHPYHPHNPDNIHHLHNLHREPGTHATHGTHGTHAHAHAPSWSTERWAQWAFERQFAHLDLNSTQDEVTPSGKIRVNKPTLSMHSVHSHSMHSTHSAKSMHSTHSMHSQSAHSLHSVDSMLSLNSLYPIHALHPLHPVHALYNLPSSTRAALQAVLRRLSGRRKKTVVPTVYNVNTATTTLDSYASKTDETSVQSTHTHKSHGGTVETDSPSPSLSPCPSPCPCALKRECSDQSYQSYGSVWVGSEC